MEWFRPPPDPVFRLDAAEYRRMNLLARRAPELSGYEAWFGELSELDRRALTCHLLRFGCEYNDASRWSEVAAGAGLALEDPIVEHLGAFRPSPDSPHWWSFKDTELFPWLEALDAERRLDAFRFAACFFGLNERERYEGCRAQGGCSHPWHQE